MRLLITIIIIESQTNAVVGNIPGPSNGFKSSSELYSDSIQCVGRDRQMWPSIVNIHGSGFGQIRVYHNGGYCLGRGGDVSWWPVINPCHCTLRHITVIYLFVLKSSHFKHT